MSKETVEMFGIVIVYLEYWELYGYLLFLAYGLICFLAYADVRPRLAIASLIIPFIWYFNQSKEVGESLHLSLATISAWTWIIANLVQNPLQSFFSIWAGSRVTKRALGE